MIFDCCAAGAAVRSAGITKYFDREKSHKPAAQDDPKQEVFVACGIESETTVAGNTFTEMLIRYLRDQVTLRPTCSALQRVICNDKAYECTPIPIRLTNHAREIVLEAFPQSGDVKMSVQNAQKGKAPLPVPTGSGSEDIWTASLDISFNLKQGMTPQKMEEWFVEFARLRGDGISKFDCNLHKS
jgi:hypothetical protein